MALESVAPRGSGAGFQLLPKFPRPGLFTSDEGQAWAQVVAQTVRAMVSAH